MLWSSASHRSQKSDKNRSHLLASGSSVVAGMLRTAMLFYRIFNAYIPTKHVFEQQGTGYTWIKHNQLQVYRRGYSKAFEPIPCKPSYVTTLRSAEAAYGAYLMQTHLSQLGLIDITQYQTLLVRFYIHSSFADHSRQRCAMGYGKDNMSWVAARWGKFTRHTG